MTGMTGRQPRWRRYLRFLRPNIGRDVDEEFAFHVLERIDDLVARGVSPRAAREEALRSFGDIDRVKATCVRLAQQRETAMRRHEWFGALRQDLTFAARQLRSSWVYTCAAVGTLALGVGAITALFSVVYAVLLRPLPYRNADRIMYIWETIGGFGQGRASVGHFHDWSEQSSVLERTAAWQARGYSLTSDGEPERLTGARVTTGFFDVLSMPPALGRYFHPDEGASRVVVLSYDLWQTRFAGDRNVIGRDIALNGENHAVIGVTPAAFTLRSVDERLWTPFRFDPALRSNYGAHSYVVLAKLKPGTTLTQAQSDLERVTDGIRERNPVEMQSRGVAVQPLLELLVSGFRTQLKVLLGAVAFVLLIACGNVASLQLARAMTRRKEIAVRGALGGSRRRIIRQLMTESLLLGSLGGVAGLGIAHYGVQFLVKMGPAFVPRLREAGLQPGVLAFALAATVICALIFGLVPALRATRGDLQSTLREGGSAARGAVRDRMRSALVIGEFAFALVLLVAAGLFIRSVIRLQQVALGFEPEGVTMVRIGLPEVRYGGPAVVQATFARLIDEVRTIPGVEAAAAGTRVPLWGPSIDAGFRVEGRDEAATGTRPSNPAERAGHVRLVSNDYHRVLGIPLKRGRLLTPADMAIGAPRVVLINEMLARQLFGKEDPIGKRVSGWAPAAQPEWREVVGIVGDVRAFGREADRPPEIYMPYTQPPDNAWNAFQRTMTVVVRTRPGTPVATGLRETVRRIDPLIPLQNLQPLGEALAQSTANRRFNTMLLSLLGTTGLVLATIGIYGLIAFFVNQRTHEIGVRMVLGATTRRITAMVVRQSATLALGGIALGALAAFWMTKSLRTMLFEVQVTDPITYIGAAVILAIAAIVAALLPAHRAARVEPVRSINAG